MNQNCSHDTEDFPLCRRLPKEEKPRRLWSARDIKGHNFEGLVRLKTSKFLMGCEIVHPRRGADFQFLSYPQLGLELECKFSHAKIFPCWIKRDWLPRFKPSTRNKVVVCNRGIQLGKKAMQLLKEYGIKLVYFDELEDFLLSLLPKILSSNHLLSNIVTNCSGFIVHVSGLFFNSVFQVTKCVVVRQFFDWFKQKNWHKSNWTMSLINLFSGVMKVGYYKN